MSTRDEMRLRPRPDVRPLVSTTLWFGIVAGWGELAMVLILRLSHSHFAPEMMRTNRHVTWMIPISLTVGFGMTGLLMSAIGRVHGAIGWWLATRSSVTLLCLTISLNIKELHPYSSFLLACGIGSIAGRWLDRRPDGFTRLVQRSLPWLVGATLAASALRYIQVESAERRALARAPAARPGAPNVLLVVLDTVRAGCLSLYGHDRPTTPNLERLASRGVVFTEARATAPWTAPTHASLMTGRWPHELSVGPTRPLDATHPTLAEILSRDGYATAGFVGNIYYCHSLLGLGRGFARYEDAYENQEASPLETAWSSGLGRWIIRGLGYSTNLEDGVTLRRKTAAMVNGDLIGWLDRRTDNRPFFAFLNYYDAHRPYILDEAPELRFGMAALPSPAQGEIDRRFLDLMEGKPIPSGYSAGQVSDEGIRLFHDSYDSSIAYLDRQIGLLIDELERRQLLDNTLVIITSDHGEQLGEHGVISHGASVHREEVHVPLLILPPRRMVGGQVVGHPVSLRDIPATIVEWVDLGTRSPFPGHSLTKFLADPSAVELQKYPVLSELQHNIVFPDPEKAPRTFGPVRSLVSREHVYVRRQDGGEELYDLHNDPMELVNLAHDPRLSNAIEEFRAEMCRIGDGLNITLR